MNIDEYLRFVASDIEKAQQKGDRAEVVRLLNLVQMACLEAITKLELVAKQQEQDTAGGER